MNKVILTGIVKSDIEFKKKEDSIPIARYILIVNRPFNPYQTIPTDYIECVAFGNDAEFAKKYFRPGNKIAITGHIQTRSCTNKYGLKAYTTNVVVEEQQCIGIEANVSFNSNQNQDEFLFE